MARELPLRRSKTLTALRATQNDHVARFQAKHQVELDLIDDIRNFAKQRSNIEKEYAQSMLRLTSQYLQKREFNSLSPPAGEQNGNRSVLMVWKTLLEETDAVCRARMSISERLATQVVEPLKSQRQSKTNLFKKCHDLASRMHAELQQSLRDVSKAKKTYKELEGIASAARRNYADAQDRRNRKSMRFYQSKSQLEKKFTQAESKLGLCEKRATVARNEYLLSLAALNAHQERYYDTDVPQLMQTMDADLFEKVRGWFMLMADMELDASTVSLDKHQSLRSQAQLISREFEVDSFLHGNRQLVDYQRFAFESQKDDMVDHIVQEFEAEVILHKEARKWATRITRENRIVRDQNKALRGLMTVSSAYTITPEFATADAQLDVDQQIDDVRNAVRKAETQKIKAEARLVVLRDAGVDVDQWMKSADISASRENLLDVADAGLSGSLMSLETTSEVPNGELDFESSPEGSFDEHHLAGALDDDDDDRSNCRYEMPRKCIVLYDYQATKDDELSIHEGEEVSILVYDGLGWCMGCNSSGDEGYFPESYVDVVEVHDESPPHDLALETQDDGDTTLTDGGVQRNTPMLKALYSYEASGIDELSFPEGAIIKLVRKDDNGVDDGFWEGEYQGLVGVFPSLLVEHLDSVSTIDSEDGLSPTLQSMPPSMPLPDASPLTDLSPDSMALHRSPVVEREFQSHPESSTKLTPQISVSGPSDGHGSVYGRPLSVRGRSNSSPEQAFVSQTQRRRAASSVYESQSSRSSSALPTIADWSKLSDDLESYV